MDEKSWQPPGLGPDPNEPGPVGPDGGAEPSASAQPTAGSPFDPANSPNPAPRPWQTQPPYAQAPQVQPPIAQPPQTQPPYAQPTYAQPPYAQPPYAQPPFAQPQHGQPGPPGSSAPSYGAWSPPYPPGYPPGYRPGFGPGMGNAPVYGPGYGSGNAPPFGPGYAQAFGAGYAPPGSPPFANSYPRLIEGGPAPGIVWGSYRIRFGAWLLDAAVLTVGSIAAGLLANALAVHDSAGFTYTAASNIVIWIWILAAFVYLPLMWAWQGASLGQMAVGLRIVRALDGGRIGVGTAIGRFVGFAVATVVSVLFAGIGFVVMMATVWNEPRKRMWQDQMADTVVIKKA